MKDFFKHLRFAQSEAEPEPLLDQVPDAGFGAADEAPAPAPPRNGPRPSLPPRSFWEFLVRGWRLMVGWMMALVMLRVVVVPLVQLARHEPVEPIETTALAAVLGVIWVSRTYERVRGNFT